MTVLEKLNIILSEYKIPNACALPLSECKLIYPRKLEAHGMIDTSRLNVLIFTVPYLVESEKSNLSDYAKSLDYHLFFSKLFEDAIVRLKEEFPNIRAVGFADNSPIDEVHAAACAGLGVIGKNGLLITQKYSSYVFIGEIITDAPAGLYNHGKINYCINCGKCLSVCPKNDIGICLSELTQKKGTLSEGQQKAIKKYGIAWGCDMCQECCPYTEKAKTCRSIYTDVEFFKKNRTEYISSLIIENMSDEEFKNRAYAWRKRDTVLRNLEIIYGNNTQKS